jgi:hypothetical protein
MLLSTNIMLKSVSDALIDAYQNRSIDVRSNTYTHFVDMVIRTKRIEDKGSLLGGSAVIIGLIDDLIGSL